MPGDAAMTEIKTQTSTPNMSGIPSPSIAPNVELASAPPSTYPDLSIFTLLPELYVLIGRLSELKNNPSAPTLENGMHGNDLAPTLSRESNNSLRMVNSSDATLIETRELPAHIYNLKRRIEEAKAVVKNLPDVHRSITEQEEEIRILKGQIAGLSKRTLELGAIAAQSASPSDTEMGGS